MSVISCPLQMKSEWKMFKELIERQIEYNEMIAQEGMRKEYGVSRWCKLCVKYYYGNDIRVRARAMAAAGSDARMSGCLYPVVINSGSGNRGITVSFGD